MSPQSTLFCTHISLICASPIAQLIKNLPAMQIPGLERSLGERIYPLQDCKENQPVYLKGNQFWIFIGRTDAEAETLATWCEELTHLNRPWYWERLKVGGEGDDREWDGWMASPTQWTWVWVNSGSWWWTGKSGCSPWGRKELDTTEWLNWCFV